MSGGGGGGGEGGMGGGILSIVQGSNSDFNVWKKVFWVILTVSRSKSIAIIMVSRGIPHCLGNKLISRGSGGAPNYVLGEQ